MQKQRVHDIFHRMIAVSALSAHAQIQVHLSGGNHLQIAHSPSAQLHALGARVPICHANEVNLIFVFSHGCSYFFFRLLAK